MAMWQSRPKGDRPGRIEIPETSAMPALVADESGLITVSAMASVALVFVAIEQLRERQADILQERLKTIAERSGGKVAISLSEVQIMTSSGINALVAANAHCETLGGHLAVFAASRELRRMFKVTKLDRKMVIVGTAHEAVKSFGDHPKKRGLFSWARPDKDAA
jgi:anti-anti-sigma factor